MNAGFVQVSAVLPLPPRLVLPSTLIVILGDGSARHAHYIPSGRLADWVLCHVDILLKIPGQVINACVILGNIDRLRNGISLPFVHETPDTPCALSVPRPPACSTSTEK